MKKLIVLILVFALAALLASCAPTQNDVSTSELNVGFTLDVGTFNPHRTTSMLEFRVLQNIFDTIIRVDPSTGEVLPMLAESWTISEDGLIYTFNLRQDVLFHNGDAFSAYNVLGNFEIWQTSINTVLIRNVLESVSVIDEFTVKMRLFEPSALFLVLLGDLAIVHDDVFNDNVDLFGERPVGTGAYMLASRHIGASIELVRFDAHFRGPADIETINIRILPDANTLAVALEMGEIDYSEAIIPASVSILKEASHLTVNILDGIMVSFIGLNVERVPFDDIRVRQAVAHAIDRQAIIDMSREGMGIPTHITHIEPMPFRPEDYPVFDFNPLRARELLTEAGFPNGIVLSEPILSIAAFVPGAQIIQSMLADVGIMVEIAPTEWAAMWPLMQDGNFSMSFTSWNATSLHPDFFVQLYRTDTIGGINHSRYSNPRVDELADMGVLTLDPVEAQEIYDELFSIITYDMPRVPVYIASFLIAHDNNLHVRTPNPISNPFFNMSWR